jgi:hypothetical protein
MNQPIPEVLAMIIRNRFPDIDWDLKSAIRIAALMTAIRSPVVAEEVVLPAGQPITHAFDTRKGAPPVTRPLLWQTGEEYVIAVVSRPPTVPLVVAGAVGSNNMAVPWSVGHMWIEWSRVERQRLVNQSAYGFWPNADGVGLIACAVHCDGEVKQEWMSFTRAQPKATSYLYFVVDQEQYTATLNAAKKHITDETGATRYGILHYSGKVMSCRGLVRDVLAAIGVSAPIPGVSLTMDYSRRIDEGIQKAIREKRSSIGMLVLPNEELKMGEIVGG